MRSNPSETLPRHQRIINRAALYLAVLLAGIGALRLVNVLLLIETVELLPLDGWLPISLRVMAVLIALGMLLVSHLRQRYLLILLSLAILTSAGVWLRLASKLPEGWQAAAGTGQLLWSLCGLGLFIAGLAQGENLVGLIEATWLSSSRAAVKSWMSEKESTEKHR